MRSAPGIVERPMRDAGTCMGNCPTPIDRYGRIPPGLKVYEFTLTSFRMRLCAVCLRALRDAANEQLGDKA